MPSESVELVRRAVEAYNRDDTAGILETWADDAVLDWSRSRGPDAGVYRGHDQIRSFHEQFRGTFEHARMETVELREVADGLVVFENIAYLTGRGGLKTQARSAWLITVENGKQTSVTLYQSKQEAIDAAGA